MENAHLIAAAAALETAAAFAEDGAIATAVEKALEAIQILEAEQRRRMAVMEAAGVSGESGPRLVKGEKA